MLDTNSPWLQEGPVEVMDDEHCKLHMTNKYFHALLNATVMCAYWVAHLQGDGQRDIEDIPKNSGCRRFILNQDIANNTVSNIST